ncbi:QueT transporter family protein [Marinilactibacillus piezotolerans]|uniref:QueT transporter family protein n=1 Tax=Marinilactibacillus piezotolerans TaxID=258723 RepID=UPI0009B159E0|nr:QueT transporter family protein [Marinilactibacillus piezotolerans]
MKETATHTFNTRKLAISALVIALYVVILAATASFSFGAYQIRIATSLYALSYLFPFLVFPLGLANALSNFFFGGLGLIDIAGGFVIGLLVSGLIAFIRVFGLPRWLIALPIIFVIGFGIPSYLSFLLGVPYWALASNLVVGQIIPGIAGVLLVNVLEKPLKVRRMI